MHVISVENYLSYYTEGLANIIYKYPASFISLHLFITSVETNATEALIYRGFTTHNQALAQYAQNPK